MKAPMPGGARPADLGRTALLGFRAVTREGITDRVRGTIAGVRTELGLTPPAPPDGTRRDQLLALSEFSRRLAAAPPAAPPADLTGYELRVFSQNGEDGVLAEIIRRSGAPGRWFVEFGAGDGTENNCGLLADVLGWSGLFIDGGDAQYAGLAHRYAANPRVAAAQALIGPGNVEELFGAHDVPAEPDVLSIDVDGSDYWIWAAIGAFRPRIVVIEYNGALPPGRRLVQPRDAGPWDETDFYGASIEALESLAAAKGYRLVHTELTGNNAFFVRDDLDGEYPAAVDVPRRRTNFWLAGARHPADPHGRRYVDLDAASRQAHTEP